MKNIANFITLTSIVSGLVPIAFYLGIKLKTLSPALKVLLVYTSIAMVNEIFSFLTKSRQNVFIHINVFTFVETILILAMYFLFALTKKYVWLYLCVAAIFTACFIAVCIHQDTLINNLSFLSSVESAIFILISAFCFFRLATDTRYHKLTDNYVFWLNTAFMIYFSGTLFLFLAADWFLYGSAKIYFRYLWAIHNLLNITYNILLARGVYAWRKSVRRRSENLTEL